MTISKTLLNFSKKIENDDVINNPQEYLGPNTDQLLDFWSKLDKLTEDQWEIIQGRYDDFLDNQGSEWYKTTNEAIEASDETIGWKFAGNAACAALYVYDFIAYDATRELIGGVKNPVFLPMFDNL